jgi:hypothetical protein
MFADRRKTDEMLRDIVNGHLRLYADNVRDVFRRRDLLERHEWLAARIALAALARPWRDFPAAPAAAAALLAWAAAAPQRRI